MKKIICAVLLFCLIVGTAGCRKQTVSEDPAITDLPSRPTTTSMEQPTSEPFHPIDHSNDPMNALSLPPCTKTIFAEDGAALFNLSYQDIQLCLPDAELAQIITDDLQGRMDVLMQVSSEVEALARENYSASDNWSAYFINISYTPTRLDSSVMSLIGNHTSYRGGTPPSMTTEAVTYDLRTGATLYLDEILTPDCTGSVLSDLIIDALAAQDSGLYSDYQTTVQARFVDSLHNIKDWYFSRNGLCFLFTPYDIAPYSSGTIIAEIPYESLHNYLKECYFPALPENATGSMYAEFYLDSDAERFTSIADIQLTNDGSPILLYSDANVTNVRIEIGSLNADSTQYVPNAIIFAASTVKVGDAIRLTTDLADEKTMIKLIYYCAEKEFSAFVTYDAMGDSINLAHG